MRVAILNGLLCHWCLYLCFYPSAHDEINYVKTVKFSLFRMQIHLFANK